MDTHSLQGLDFFRICELLAGYAMTDLGRALAATIRPVTREVLVRRWFDQLHELQRLAEERGPPPFAGITDIRETVRRCAPPLQVSAEDIARVGDALAATHTLVRYLSDLPSDYTELGRLGERIGDFGTIAERIQTVIDERSRVRDDASPKLTRIRGDIQAALQQIRHAVERTLRDPETRRLLQFPNYTFHNDRLVFPVRSEYRGRLPGIIHRASDSGATVYVEPSEAVELNNKISTLRAEEAEEISRLLWELAHEIYINADAILTSLDALAVLDLLVAKLRFARDFEMRLPELVSGPLLNVRQARHPLLVDLARRKLAADEPADEVVPISYRLGDDFNLLIITGPNTGGKTVTLKTVGLLTLMVQAGLPVPVAEGSRFGLFKRVLIDIGDEQSMRQSLSTFSAHLQRQMDMLRKAHASMLILIDELGAGTDPDEGAAIGRAILDELLRLEGRCMVTTHIGALKGFPLTRERAENACVEFDAETLKPTYRLRIGEPGMSNAIAIAQRLGMPHRLINSARRNLSRRARMLRAVVEGAAGAKREAELARTAAESARLEADRAQDAADAARTSLEREQADFQKWVQRVVHLQNGDPVRVRHFDRDGRLVRLRLDQQRAEVDVGAFTVEVPLGDVLPPETPAPPPRPQPAPAAKPKAEKQRKETKRLASAPPESPPRRRRRPERKPELHYAPLTAGQLEALQPGDRIVVKRLHREGRIVRIEQAKQVAFVSVGLFEVEVPFDGLALSQPPARRERRRQTPEKTPSPEPPSPQPSPQTDMNKQAKAEKPAATTPPPTATPPAQTDTADSKPTSRASEPPSAAAGTPPTPENQENAQAR